MKHSLMELPFARMSVSFCLLIVTSSYYSSFWRIPKLDRILKSNSWVKLTWMSRTHLMSKLRMFTPFGEYLPHSPVQKILEFKLDLFSSIEKNAKRLWYQNKDLCVQCLNIREFIQWCPCIECQTTSKFKLCNLIPCDTFRINFQFYSTKIFNIIRKLKTSLKYRQIALLMMVF